MPATLAAKRIKAFKDVVGVSQKDMETVYHVGHTAYQQGKYQDAAKFFGYLCLLDTACDRFWLALGMARQKLEDYHGAIDAYAMAGHADSKNPRPPLFAAECALHVGELAQAQSALIDAHALAEHDEKPDAILDRVAALQLGLNRQLGTA